MKTPDLSQYQCPRCLSTGHLYVTEFPDSHYRYIKCGFCWWWTWLSNLSTLKLTKQYDAGKQSGDNQQDDDNAKAV